VPMFRYEDSLGRIDAALQGAQERYGDTSQFEIMATAPYDRPVTTDLVEEMTARGVTSLFVSGWERDFSAGPVNLDSVATKRAQLERLADTLGLGARR
jgi:hypothetical protein